jgi:hypothetical protein
MSFLRTFRYDAPWFSEQYKFGQELQLFTGKEPLTTARVTSYDRNGLGFLQSKNHWHIVVEDPDTGLHLPAAIYKHTPDNIGPHIFPGHEEAEALGQPMVFTPAYLEAAVGNLAAQTTRITLLT